MNDDWELFRSNVAYCDGDNDRCMGTGDVYFNTRTYQFKIDVFHDNNHYKYDLTEYTSKEGYNMRFWDTKKSTYYYVYINRF